jgi:hypothetical protein
MASENTDNFQSASYCTGIASKQNPADFLTGHLAFSMKMDRRGNFLRQDQKALTPIKKWT